MVKPIDRTIASTVPERDLARGASLLIAEEGRFLVAARPPIETDSRILVNLTGVGGWIEEGETFAEAVQRESIEETGSPVHLLDLRETLLIRSPENIEEVCIIGEVGPAAIIYIRVGAPPFDPWSDEYA
ncbi:MAG: NUDIX domain-containing protein, partial [Chloroflexota bacterium]